LGVLAGFLLYGPGLHPLVGQTGLPVGGYVGGVVVAFVDSSVPLLGMVLGVCSVRSPLVVGYLVGCYLGFLLDRCFVFLPHSPFVPHTVAVGGSTGGLRVGSCVLVLGRGWVGWVREVRVYHGIFGQSSGSTTTMGKGLVCSDGQFTGYYTYYYYTLGDSYSG
jgi:hypothetical protein